MRASTSTNVHDTEESHFWFVADSILMIIIEKSNNCQAFTSAEDAYFVASQNWLGVADGVGQWSLEGICL